MYIEVPTPWRQLLDQQHPEWQQITGTFRLQDWEPLNMHTIGDLGGLGFRVWEVMLGIMERKMEATI